MKATIAVLPGDGVGPEVMAEALALLRVVAECGGHTFTLCEGVIGGAAIDVHGNPLPDQTREICTQAHAVLLGAVGGPRWSNPQAVVRPEQGLLALRAALGVHANLRPVTPHPALMRRSPIKGSLLQGVDILFVRELTGGIYFGDKYRDGDVAFDVCRYSVAEVERITRLAAVLARGRRRHITHVDKANVLETSRLWRETVDRVLATEFPDVQVSHVLVDTMAMQLVTRPSAYDVILTENLFGDILTDEAAALVGSMGLLPSASLNGDGRGLYEPVHGSAPDIAGHGVANPIAMLLSVAMMFRHSLGLHDEARLVEDAVVWCMGQRIVTRDLVASSRLHTRDVGKAVCRKVRELAGP
ncbi:MAG: 3-isopropylmalate dehydrogenase [Gemmatimonadaceae bacterium]|nr:3-isopropylmalate dehydrogenase [Gemmatimonadaceae bacterium]